MGEKRHATGAARDVTARDVRYDTVSTAGVRFSPGLVVFTVLFVAGFVFIGVAGDARSKLVDRAGAIASAADEAAHQSDELLSTVTAASKDPSVAEAIPTYVHDIDGKVTIVDAKASEMDDCLRGFWAWTARAPLLAARARVTADREHVAGVRATAARVP